MPKPITVDPSAGAALAWGAARDVAKIAGVLAAAKLALPSDLIDPTLGVIALGGAFAWSRYRDWKTHTILVRLADALPDSLAVVRRAGYDGGVNPTRADTSPRRDQPMATLVTDGASQAGPTQILGTQADTPVITAGSDTASDQAAANHAAALTAVAPVLATAAVQQAGGTFGAKALNAFSAMLLAAESNLATIFAVTRSSATTQLEVEGGAVVLNAAIAGLQALRN